MSIDMVLGKGKRVRKRPTNIQMEEHTRKSSTNASKRKAKGSQTKREKTCGETADKHITVADRIDEAAMLVSLVNLSFRRGGQDSVCKLCPGEVLARNVACSCAEWKHAWEPKVSQENGVEDAHDKNKLRSFWSTEVEGEIGSFGIDQESKVGWCRSEPVRLSPGRTDKEIKVIIGEDRYVTSYRVFTPATFMKAKARRYCESSKTVACVSDTFFVRLQPSNEPAGMTGTEIVAESLQRKLECSSNRWDNGPLLQVTVKVLEDDKEPNMMFRVTHPDRNTGNVLSGLALVQGYDYDVRVLLPGKSPMLLVAIDVSGRAKEVISFSPPISQQQDQVLRVQPTGENVDICSLEENAKAGEIKSTPSQTPFTTPLPNKSVLSSTPTAPTSAILPAKRTLKVSISDVVVPAQFKKVKPNREDVEQVYGTNALPFQSKLENIRVDTGDRTTSNLLVTPTPSSFEIEETDGETEPEEVGESFGNRLNISPLIDIEEDVRSTFTSAASTPDSHSIARSPSAEQLERAPSDVLPSHPIYRNAGLVFASRTEERPSHRDDADPNRSGNMKSRPRLVIGSQQDDPPTQEHSLNVDHYDTVQRKDVEKPKSHHDGNPKKEPPLSRSSSSLPSKKPKPAIVNWEGPDATTPPNFAPSVPCFKMAGEPLFGVKNESGLRCTSLSETYPSGLVFRRSTSGSTHPLSYRMAGMAEDDAGGFRGSQGETPSNRPQIPESIVIPTGKDSRESYAVVAMLGSPPPKLELGPTVEGMSDDEWSREWDQIWSRKN